MPEDEVETYWDIAPQPRGGDNLATRHSPKGDCSRSGERTRDREGLCGRDGKDTRCKILDAWPKEMEFEEEVMKVIFAWRFLPAIREGKPVGTWIQFPIDIPKKTRSGA